MDRYELGRSLETDKARWIFFQVGNEVDSRRRASGRFPQGEACFDLVYALGIQVHWKSAKVLRALLTATQSW